MTPRTDPAPFPRRSATGAGSALPIAAAAAALGRHAATPAPASALAAAPYSRQRSPRAIPSDPTATAAPHPPPQLSP